MNTVDDDHDRELRLGRRCLSYLFYAAMANAVVGVVAIGAAVAGSLQ